MDFFHIWLRRALWGLSPEIDAGSPFEAPLGPKWDAAANDGELIDDAARFGGDRAASKRNYEGRHRGRARAFSRFHAAPRDDGRLVIVFANKSPDAWETLVSAPHPRRVRGGRLVAHPDRAAGAHPRPCSRRPSPRRSGSSAASARPRAPAGTPRCSPRCARTSPASSATSADRRHPRPRLRVGGDGTGPGGVLDLRHPAVGA